LNITASEESNVSPPEYLNGSPFEQSNIPEPSTPPRNSRDRWALMNPSEREQQMLLDQEYKAEKKRRKAATLASLSSKPWEDLSEGQRKRLLTKKWGDLSAEERIEQRQREWQRKNPLRLNKNMQWVYGPGDWRPELWSRLSQSEKQQAHKQAWKKLTTEEQAEKKVRDWESRAAVMPMQQDEWAKHNAEQQEMKRRRKVGEVEGLSGGRNSWRPYSNSWKNNK